MNALTSDRVIDSGIAVLIDEFKEFLPPRIIQVMEDLIAEFPDFGPIRRPSLPSPVAGTPLSTQRQKFRPGLSFSFRI